MFSENNTQNTHYFHMPWWPNRNNYLKIRKKQVYWRYTNFRFRQVHVYFSTLGYSKLNACKCYENEQAKQCLCKSECLIEKLYIAYTAYCMISHNFCCRSLHCFFPIDLHAGACRDLVMPRVTAWLYAPLPNSSIEEGFKYRYLK